MRRECDEQENVDRYKQPEEDKHEDSWEEETRDMEGKSDTRQMKREEEYREAVDQEVMDQDAISIEVLKDIWIKEGKNWDLEKFWKNT